MKILFLVNNDLPSNFALNQIFPKLAQCHQLHLWQTAQVGKGGKTGKAGKTPILLQRLKFFEQDCFNQLLSPLMAHRQDSAKFTSFAGLASYCATALQQINNINSETNLEKLRALAPDLIVSIRYGCILKAKAIAVPRMGVLNLHSGILPDYRGVMATFWALKNQETEIGSTLHTIDDASIDTGQVIQVSKQPVDSGKSYLWHVLGLYQQGSKDILDAIDTLASGRSLTTQPQQGNGNYYSFPNQQDLDEFAASGNSLYCEAEYIEFLQQHYV